MQEKTAMIVRILYCLKSAGSAFRSHLDKCMDFLEYESCKAHLHICLKPETRPEDGVQYYSYILYYVGDILCIHHNAEAMLEHLHKYFPFKLGFGKPDMHLGAKMHKTRLHNGVWAWVMSHVKYV